MDPMPDIDGLSLADIARLAAEQRLPPVENWNPAHCGHSDMRIAADGTWFHQGSPIGRTEMVRLFSTILRREADGSYVLVTPVEKLTIDVEDAPFIAVELRSEGEGKHRSLAFRLNIGDIIIAGRDHAIDIVQTADGPRPYLHVRKGLKALIARPVYYELAHIAIEESDSAHDVPGLWSDGEYFPLDRAA